MENRHNGIDLRSGFLIHNYKGGQLSGRVEDLKYENGFIILIIRPATEEKIIKLVLAQREFNATARNYYWDGGDNILRLRKITKGKFFSLESGID